MIKRCLPATAIALFIVVTLLNVFYVWRYAIDVPYWDEWEALKADNLPGGLSWKWLLALHNEHRIVPTKLQTYLLYVLADWNLRVQQLVNVILFSAAVGCVVAFVRRQASGSPAWPWLAFAAVLMSPRLFENRLWGFQSQFFFAWVFPVIASWCLFRVERRPALMVGAAAALVLGAYSFAGGLVMSLVVTCVYVVFAAGRWIQGDKRTLPTAAVLVLLPVAAGISWWLLQYSKPAWHPQPATPWEWRFWPFFVNLVDSGFGIDQLGVERGFFFTTILALPFAGLLWRDRGRFEPATWALGAVALGLFGFLASVTMGRAPFHLADSKTSRYIEVSALLIPLAAGAYWLLLKEWPLWRRRTLVAFWLLTLGSIYDNWSFERYFEPISTRNQRGRDCIAQYYAVGGDGLCAEIYPRPLKHQLDTAQRLGISFAKDLARPASSQP